MKFWKINFRRFFIIITMKAITHWCPYALTKSPLTFIEICGKLLLTVVFLIQVITANESALKGEILLSQVFLKCGTYVVPKMKKDRHSVECQPFMSVPVARRGIEPLISRMKTWRPNRLDERAKVFLGVQNYKMYWILQNIFAGWSDTTLSGDTCRLISDRLKRKSRTYFYLNLLLFRITFVEIN